MKESSDTDILNLSLHLISSLLDSIPTVIHFKGKWSLIQAKLISLQTHLSDFQNEFPNCPSNPLSLHLLHSISLSLNHALSLSQSPPQGKLKTQNDLDSLLTTLDQHVKDCDILFRSGVLQDSIFMPSSVSKREAVRCECRSLITRLQIGSEESKKMALDDLLGVLEGDDKNVMIAVAQGVVPVLVRLMDNCCGCYEMREKAVAGIARVSVVDSGRHVLVAEGLLLLNQLVRVLDSGSGFAKQKACVCLEGLTFCKENARAVGSGGGVDSLLEICQAGTPASQAAAAGVLRNLSVFCEIRESFMEENSVVVVLLGLASSGTVLAQENAIGCLGNLVSGDERLKLLFVKEGGIECMKNFWDSASQVRSLEVAAELLSHLASNSPIADVLVTNGFIVRLVGVLNCGILGVRIAAARAVYAFGLWNVKSRKEMGECGCVTLLIKMLDGKAVEEKEAAAKALSVLMLYAGNRKIFRKDERGIASAVQLLDPSVPNLDKKYPVSVLASLVHSKKCRKHMVAAGACVYTQKLVEMDVEGAKKLLDSLGSGKIWGVFARP